MQYFAIYIVFGLLTAIALLIVKHNDPAPLTTKAAALIMAVVTWPFYVFYLVRDMFAKQNYCAFCGYVPKEDEDILEHIEVCEKHPAHQWALDRDKYKAALEKIISNDVRLDEDDETIMYFVAKEALGK
jgi:hypothetical protein